MKKYVIYLFVVLSSLTVSAQDKVKHVSVEFFGAQNTVGINYDSRFKGNDGLGFRVGLGYGYGNNSSFFGDNQKIKGVGMPLEINYLLGKRKHKFELGLGTSLGIYRVEETTTYYYGSSREFPTEKTETYIDSGNRFGYCVFGNVGYRYQRPKGFVFRAGFSPSFNFGDKHGLNKSLLYPYIGMGWSF